MAAFTARDRDAFMDHWQRILEDDSVLAQTVMLDDRVAGNVVSWERDGRRQLGYWIGQEYWGNGIATQAVNQFLTIEQQRPLYAKVVSSNAASIRVLQKCQFKPVTEDSPACDTSNNKFEVFALN